MNSKNLILPNKKLVTGNGQQTKTPEKVFIGMPSRTGNISAGSAQAAMAQVTQSRIVLFRVSTHTNLELNYNILLCDALNLHEHDGIKWFAMLHDDIIPESFWLDKLIDEAEAHNADVMSAHSPLKDPRGISSTAISAPGDPWVPFTRLTLKQIWHPDFPDTIDTKTALEGLRNLPAPFTLDCPDESQLLINTGCMVIRVDRPWVHGIRFHKRDDIVREGDQNIWAPMTWTEDWMLSQDLHAIGAKVMATRHIKMTHFDGKNYFSNEPNEYGQNVDESTRQVRMTRKQVT